MTLHVIEGCPRGHDVRAGEECAECAKPVTWEGVELKLRKNGVDVVPGVTEIDFAGPRCAAVSRGARCILPVGHAEEVHAYRMLDADPVVVDGVNGHGLLEIELGPIAPHVAFTLEVGRPTTQNVFTIRLDPDLTDAENAENAEEQLRAQHIHARVVVTSEVPK